MNRKILFLIMLIAASASAQQPVIIGTNYNGALVGFVNRDIWFTVRYETNTYVEYYDPTFKQRTIETDDQGRWIEKWNVTIISKQKFYTFIDDENTFTNVISMPVSTNIAHMKMEENWKIIP